MLSSAHAGYLSERTPKAGVTLDKTFTATDKCTAAVIVKAYCSRRSIRAGRID
jgi:hypothetical protein